MRQTMQGAHRCPTADFVQKSHSSKRSMARLLRPGRRPSYSTRRAAGPSKEDDMTVETPKLRGPLGQTQRLTELPRTFDLAPEILIRTDDVPWIEFGGISYKVLRLSPENGAWTILLRGAAGSTFPSHVHEGAAEFFILSGRADYRAGSARSNDYGYEPIGVYHESTTFVEDTILFYVGHGPLAMVDPDSGDLVDIVGWQTFANDLVPEHNIARRD
jgi:2,4'-dihydroxyacetophenone dioxygenase